MTAIPTPSSTRPTIPRARSRCKCVSTGQASPRRRWGRRRIGSRCPPTGARSRTSAAGSCWIWGVSTATARRLLGTRPLSLQFVHQDDSVLGPLSRSPFRGLNVTYQDLVRQAFQPRWWDSPRFIQVAADGTTRVVSQPDTDPATAEFTLMEYNFSLFFGLAVQAYEATLVADDTPFDRFLAGGPPLGRGRPGSSGSSSTWIRLPRRAQLRLLPSGSLTARPRSRPSRLPAWCALAGGQLSDRGTRNIGVRETTDDLGNGGSDPSWRLAVGGGAGCPPGAVVAADRTFKIPGLRNVALTAPYFHNGGEATLRRGRLLRSRRQPGERDERS